MRVLTGEPLALDLVNTRAMTPNGEIDALSSAADFQAWLREQAHRLDPPAAPLTAADVRAVGALREHVAGAVEAVRAGRVPPRSALAALNEALRRAPRHLELTRSGATLTARTRRTGDPRAGLLAQLAEAAVELLTDPRASTIRVCEGPLCRMLFLPAHPRRRWCNPAVCGNRVRVARYYRRHNR